MTGDPFEDLDRLLEIISQTIEQWLGWRDPGGNWIPPYLRRPWWQVWR